MNSSPSKQDETVYGETTDERQCVLRSWSVRVSLTVGLLPALLALPGGAGVSVAAEQRVSEATAAGVSGLLQFVPRGAGCLPPTPAEPATNPTLPAVGALELPRRLPRWESSSSPPPSERPCGGLPYSTIAPNEPHPRAVVFHSAADACTVLCRFLL